jgi:hypothetical protein
VQKQAIVKRRSLIDIESDSWIECVMTAVWDMLDKQYDGVACITTPRGRACHVSVRFADGGRA